MAQVLAQSGGRTFLEATIRRAREFNSPFPGVGFPCLIWDHGAGWADEDRLALAAALLASGCRYAVCGGDSCEAWHDSVDLAFVKAHGVNTEELPDADFVMTSWHEGESPDDVAFFFVLNTNFDEHDFRNFLVLHVGDGPLRGAVNQAVRQHAQS
jgi:hypothetical protein